MTYIEILFLINNDDELFFHSYYNLVNSLSNPNHLNFTIQTINCCESFQTSVEHFINKTVPKPIINFIHTSSISELSFNSSFTLVIDSNFLFNNDNNNNWLNDCILTLIEKKHSKLFLSNQENPPYIINSKSTSSESSLYHLQLFSNFYENLLSFENKGLFENSFDNRINVNCHIPILVLHDEKPNKDTFKKFGHQFLRFIHFFWNDSNSKKYIDMIISKFSPKTLLTIGNNENMTSSLSSHPFEIRKKWIHFANYDDFKIQYVEYCIFASHDHHLQPDNPIISIITPTFESLHRINRPYNSLKNQTYKNWEWIIIDDSITNKTWNDLQNFAQNDFRIQIYKRHENNGYIGKNKYFCSSLAKGQLIFELDHDDDITPNALQTLVNAYKKFPNAGLYYSDFIECNEPINNYCHPFSYGPYFGLGFGSYYRQWFNGAFQYVAKTPRPNPYTLRHIVGVPNHFRCWSKAAYVDIGSHNQDLSVVDDYDLIIRTFLKYDWVHIPELLYVQYRNTGGSNFTFYRNKLIQYIVKKTQERYEKRLQDRFKELGVNDISNFYNHPNDYTIDSFEFPILEKIYYEPDSKDNFPCISVIIPTFNRPHDLKNALDSVFKQTYTNFEILLVGDKCPILDHFIISYEFSKDKRLKWFNLHENNGAGGAVPRNYALKAMCSTKWVAYLDDDNQWTENHLQSLIDCKNNNPSASYIFSSLLVENKEIIFNEKPRKGRIDTNCLLHKFDLLIKYGLWKDRIKACYWHDFELVSRWKDEPFAATELATVIYNTSYNGQSFDSIMNL